MSIQLTMDMGGVRFLEVYTEVLEDWTVRWHVRTLDSAAPTDGPVTVAEPRHVRGAAKRARMLEVGAAELRSMAVKAAPDVAVILRKRADAASERATAIHWWLDARRAWGLKAE